MLPYLPSYEEIDFLAEAEALRVVDVWQPNNETGWTTDAVLWDPTVKADDGYVKAPHAGAWLNWLLHGTAGSNTLRFWGQHGSVLEKTWTLAHLLVPKDTTVYADGIAHTTKHTVFKMVKPGYACNHTGVCAAGVNNSNSLGVEHESFQNGTHDFTPNQYINSALLYAYESAHYGIRDWRCNNHGTVAIDPVGRRSDPYAGQFDIAYWWQLVTAIRADARVWKFWNLPQPARLGGI